MASYMAASASVARRMGTTAREWRRGERRRGVSAEKRKRRMRDAGGSASQRRASATECGVSRRERRERQGKREGSDGGSVERSAWRASPASSSAARGGAEVWMGEGAGPAGEWRDSGRSKRTAAEHLIRSSRRIDRSRRTKAAAAAAAGSGTAVGVGEMEWAAKRGYWSEGFAGSN
jgi:hypothetical protein